MKFCDIYSKAVTLSRLFFETVDKHNFNGNHLKFRKNGAAM